MLLTVSGLGSLWEQTLLPNRGQSTSLLDNSTRTDPRSKTGDGFGWDGTHTNETSSHHLSLFGARMATAGGGEAAHEGDDEASSELLVGDGQQTVAEPLSDKSPVETRAEQENADGKGRDVGIDASTVLLFGNVPGD